METFKIGDIVQLKSGGPEMTVYRADKDSISCTWFVSGQPQYASFPPEALLKFGD